jgi:hypothetical protein
MNLAQEVTDPPDSDRQAAADTYRAALEAGETLSGAELARRYNRPDRWGRRVIDGVRAELADTVPPPTASTNGSHRTPDTVKADTRPAVKRTRPRTPRPSKGGHVPVAFVVVTGLGVTLVAAVAAVASYAHLRDLADTAGMGALSAWLPLGVDGLGVSATASLLVDRQRGRRPDPLAVLGVALGVLGSVAGNVMAVDAELVDIRHVRLALAAYPPLALAIAGHLLVRMVLGDRR